MVAYTTTRGGRRTQLREAVLNGLAPDGGLYVPAPLPRLSEPTLARLRADSDPAPPTLDGSTFGALAARVAPDFFPTLDPTLVEGVVASALDFPVPLVEVEAGVFVLELFHGPTHAFKDVGARFMAALVERLEAGSGPRLTVLVATSGDTGGAVASAFHGTEGVRVVVLFPADGVSERQRRQMTTLGDKVFAVAVDGSFDTCQGMVKEAFADRALSNAYGLTSANSINVARLLPQALYYVHAVELLAGRGAPHFVVPCGNLGNLCAGLLAGRAGAPVDGFTAATNENRGFVDYLAGAPFVEGPSRPTTSNAMDVGRPSNLERIRWLYDGDDDAVRRAISGVAVEQGDVARRIRTTYEETGYVLDPHTAVAYEAASRRRPDLESPLVVLATAHPAKFPDVVEAQIGRAVPLPPGLTFEPGLEERILRVAPDVRALATLLETLP